MILDVLNNVMYIATFLNWPITDSLLMGQILSITKDDFDLPGNPFVKPTHCIVGVNAPFNSCLSSPHLENSEKFKYLVWMWRSPMKGYLPARSSLTE